MTDEKRYTQAEYMKGQRSAYLNGVNDRAQYGLRHPLHGANWEGVAHEHYPAPTITRPRSIWCIGVAYHTIQREYRWIDGILQCHSLPGEPWATCFYVPMAHIREVAGLLANPTETVPLEDE